MANLISSGEGNIEDLQNNQIWNKLFEDTDLLISVATTFPVQEEKVCFDVAQHYGTNPALSHVAFLFIIPSLLHECKHFSRTMLKAVEIFANSFPNMVIDNYLLPGFKAHEAKDVGKVYKSIIKLLPSQNQLQFLEKLIEKLSHEEWPMEAMKIVASCLELKPSLSPNLVSSILNSLLSFTNIQCIKTFASILVHLAKFHATVCKQRREEILRITPNIGKLQRRIIEMKLR